MKSLLSFTLEHFLLFEASLLQYAYFAAAQSSRPGNLSTTCAGCVIHADQTILSYPASVSETVTSSSVTVIPYVTVYDDGQSRTEYSTYTAYASGSANTAIVPAAPLTWETYGTVLTYPTTYFAYPSVSAATSTRRGDGSCTFSLTPLTVQPSDQARLIFPSTPGIDIAAVTSSAKALLDSVNGVAPIVSPFAPASCSKGIGGQAVLGTQTTQAPAATPIATSASVEAVTHTSVRYLTTQGQAVITRRTGNAPPQQEQTNPPSNIPSNGGQGGNNNQSPAPTITWGGSTYTGGAGGSWNFGQGSLTPGGPAQTIGGTTVSVAPGGSVVFNGQTTSASSPTTSGPVQATGGAEPQVPKSLVSWAAGGAIGFLGVFVGVYL